MSSCLPTLAPSDTKNFIWSILSWLSRMIFPPPVLSQKQAKHQKNCPLGVCTEKPRPPENSSGQASKGTFFIDLSLWNSSMLEDFTVIAWCGKKKSGQTVNKGRTSILHYFTCYLPFEREVWGELSPCISCFFKASKACLLPLQGASGVHVTWGYVRVG